AIPYMSHSLYSLSPRPYPPTSPPFPYTTLFRSQIMSFHRGAILLSLFRRHVRHEDSVDASGAGISRNEIQSILQEGIEVAEYHRSEEHTSELQSRVDLVCRLLLEKKKEIIEIKR